MTILVAYSKVAIIMNIKYRELIFNKKKYDIIKKNTIQG